MWRAIRPAGLSTAAFAFLLAWAVGSLAWFTMQGVRVLRFAFWLNRMSAPCEPLQGECDELAARMGLRQAPRLLVVDATMSPMLWGLGRKTRLLIPNVLAERLDAETRATLIAHELAHFVRCDHWVRVLEVIALGLFWWHPVAWWARREIEFSEEECCDSWVVSQLPDSPRRYAGALLDTIDFLCETQMSLPPIASGLGSADVLRHRLTRIMQCVRRQTMSRRLRAGTALIAAALLPMQPFVFASIEEMIPSVDLPTIAEDADQSLPQSALPQALESFVPREPLTFDRLTNLPMTQPPSQMARSRRGEKEMAVATSPTGRYTIRKLTGRRLLLTNIASHTDTDLSQEDITSVAFTASGETFFATDLKGRVTEWNAATGKLIREIPVASDILRSIAISPDGTLLAVGGRENVLRLLRTNTGELHAEVETSGPVNCVRFSPDSQRVAAAIGDWQPGSAGEVELWNIDTGSLLTQLPSAASPGAIAFASDDELIVGDWNDIASLWNLRTNAIVRTADMKRNTAAAAAFSPDNALLRELPFQSVVATVDPTALESFSSWFLRPAPQSSVPQFTAPPPAIDR
jgi:beta-lactamase regulating signal transducer with metallopeptidase domain